MGRHHHVGCKTKRKRVEKILKLAPSHILRMYSIPHLPNFVFTVPPPIPSVPIIFST
jgi:hypothetical protein